MTLRMFLASCMALPVLVLAQPSFAADPVARVNGINITEAEMAFAEEEVGSELAGFPPEYRRRVILEYLVEVHLFAEAGEKKQYGKTPDFENRLNYYRLRALRDTFYAKEVQAAAHDQAKATYEERIAKLPPAVEVRARYLPAKSEDDAKSIIKQLKSGTNFEDLAKKLLEGDVSQTGGDLGYFSQGQMPKPLEDAAFALKKGDISEPLQIDSRWIVIKVEDRRNRPVPTFDEAKDQVVSELVVSKVKGLAQDLRKVAKIEVVDPDLKKAIEEEAKAASAPAADKKTK